MSAWKAVDRSKNWWNTPKGLKSSNDNWWDHTSDLPISQGVSLGSASWLRTVIDRTTLENCGILPLKDKDIRTAAFRDWAKGRLIVTSCFKWRVKEEGNQVNLEKHHQGILQPARIAPPYLYYIAPFKGIGYWWKGWMENKLKRQSHFWLCLWSLIIGNQGSYLKLT